MKDFVILSVFLILAGSAYAQDKTESVSNETAPAHELTPLVISGNRVEEPLDESTATVTLIQAPAFEGQAVLLVSELFDEVPGVTPLTLGTPGSTSNIIIRGSSAGQVVVLLDGVKVNRSFNDIYDFDDLPLDAVQQVEILRGSYSALYGSEAMGGVIHVRSKTGLSAFERVRGVKSVTTLSLQGGTHETFQEALGQHGSQDNVDYGFWLSRTDTKGQFSHDAYFRNYVQGNAVLHLAPNMRFSAGTQFLEGVKEFPVGFAFADPSSGGSGNLYVTFDDNRLQSRRQLLLRGALEWEPLSWLETQVRLSGFDTDFAESDSTSAYDQAQADQAELGAIPIGGPLNLNERQTEFGLQNTLHLTQRSRFILGADYRKQGMFVDTVPLERNRETYAAYGEAIVKELRFRKDDELILNAGGRIEHDTSSGTFASPRGGFLLRFKQPLWTDLRFHYGSGMRAPNVQELFNPVIGNPNLKEERSHSLEAGLIKTLAGDRVRLGVTGFYVDYQNLIVNLLPFQNVNTARTLGVETELGLHPWDWLGLAGHYTYTDTELNSGGRNPTVPYHQAALRLDLAPLPGLQVFGEGKYVGDAVAFIPILIPAYLGMTSMAPGGHNPQWHRFDVGVEAALHKLLAGPAWRALREEFGFKELTVAVNILNIGNKKYFEDWGFLAPDRTFRLLLKAKF